MKCEISLKQLWHLNEHEDVCIWSPVSLWIHTLMRAGFLKHELHQILISLASPTRQPAVLCEDESHVLQPWYRETLQWCSETEITLNCMIEKVADPWPGLSTISGIKFMTEESRQCRLEEVTSAPSPSQNVQLLLQLYFLVTWSKNESYVTLNWCYSQLKSEKWVGSFTLFILTFNSIDSKAIFFFLGWRSAAVSAPFPDTVDIRRFFHFHTASVYISQRRFGHECGSLGSVWTLQPHSGAH